MNASTATVGDADLVRTTARRVAWQLSITGALMVVIVAGLAFVLGPVLHQGSGDDDDLTDGALLVAGIIGIGIGVLVGVVAARRAVAPLRHALALQRRLVAVTAHELRTPLTVLHTRAQLVAHLINPDDPARPQINQLLDDSTALHQILDDMVDKP